MKIKSIYLIALLLFSAFNALAQDTNDKEKQDKQRELKEKAIVLLRETRGEVNGLRTIENRISFTSELADLMWFYDEQEGKKMFENVVNDYVQLLNRYNAELNMYGGVKDENELWMGRVSPTDKSRAINRMSKAVNVRQQIAMAIASHDAEIGFRFVELTTPLITDEFFKKSIEQQNERLESAIIEFMSNQDVDKALALARKALKTKFRNSMLSLLGKVYAKDQEKGREFASEIVDKVKSEMKDKDPNFQGAAAVLDYAENYLDTNDKVSGKKPLFNESSLKELAENFADALMRSENIEEYYLIESYTNFIERFSPSSATRLRNKFKEKNEGNESGVGFGVGRAKIVPPPPPSSTDLGENVSPPGIPSPEELKEANQKRKLFENLKNGKLKEIPEEDKQKIIKQAQEIIASTNNPTEKILALSGLATVVKQLGDDEFASQLMGEASQLVNPYPKTYLDFMQSWTLAGGYSSVDADKSFPILDDVVFRLNETIEAFVKVGEFIDVGEDMIIDNEVQIGSFGGAMTRGIISGLRNSDMILKNLAEKDFDKTKSLVERFSRREVRVMAKMLILRSILDDGKNKDSFNEMDYMGF